MLSSSLLSSNTPHWSRHPNMSQKTYKKETYAHQKRRENETFYGVAINSMLPSIIDLFCERAL